MNGGRSGGETRWLQCTTCAARFDLGPFFHGCPACASVGRHGTVEPRYDLAVLSGLDRDAWLGRPGRSIWKYRELLPLPEGVEPLSLGEGDSPLVPGRALRRRHGMERAYWKNETVNPTWSHKDRYNSVAVSMAPVLGYRRVTTSSTGNHGVSCAAYAATGGLQSLILYPPETSTAMLHLTGLYGGHALVTGWEARARRLTELVERGDWYPSNAWGGRRTGNPFGIDGYKTIAYELVRDLGGRAPDAIVFPVAAGNLLYGTWKGLRELVSLGWIERLPRLYACQSAGANSLGPSLERGLDEVIVLDEAYSVATSTRERTADRHALRAIRESGGCVVVVTDAECMAAMRLLGEDAICAEPSSAVPAAALPKLLADGRIGAGETVVSIITSAGVKWPELLPEAARRMPIRVGPAREEFDAALAELGLTRS